MDITINCESTDDWMIICITDIVQMWNVDCIYDTLWCWILSYLWTSYLWTDYATSDTQRYKGGIDV